MLPSFRAPRPKRGHRRGVLQLRPLRLLPASTADSPAGKNNLLTYFGLRRL